VTERSFGNRLEYRFHRYIQFENLKLVVRYIDIDTKKRGFSGWSCNIFRYRERCFCWVIIDYHYQFGCVLGALHISCLGGVFPFWDL